MAEHGVDDPVWGRPQGTGYPVRLADFGVGEDLAARLREWNGQLQRTLLDESLSDGSVERSEWVNSGLQLATTCRLRFLTSRSSTGKTETAVRCASVAGPDQPKRPQGRCR
jgi:hypothetical protein